jgi:hypothetical protein
LTFFVRIVIIAEVYALVSLMGDAQTVAGTYFSPATARD